MATPQTISASTDIARSPEEVFDLLADAKRLPEWQTDVEEAAFDEPASVGVGSKGHEVRHVPGGPRTFQWEVTEYEPGSRYGVRGLNGPVRAHVSVALAPTADGAGTHVDYGMWFEAHGIGKIVVPLLANRGARKELPNTLQRLKQRLEHSQPQ